MGARHLPRRGVGVILEGRRSRMDPLSPGVHSSATGMAANDTNPQSDRPEQSAAGCMSAAALNARVEEEIGRAERHQIPLSCLLVVVENLEELTREHGGELREQTLEYVASALQRELRRFDRVGHGAGGELAIVLPGADGPRGEVVARRALERVRTIKVEAGGERRPLEIAVGLATWRGDVGGPALLAQARAALRSVNGDHAQHQQPPAHSAATTARQTPDSTGARTPAGAPSALRGAGSA
jgi:diguanylate cyclase (GGDEF)-like protein